MPYPPGQKWKVTSTRKRESENYAALDYAQRLGAVEDTAWETKGILVEWGEVRIADSFAQTLLKYRHPRGGEAPHVGRTLAGASGRGFRARCNAADEIVRAATQGLPNLPVKYRENLADRPIRIGVSYHITGGGASPPRMDGGRWSRRATPNCIIDRIERGEK